MQPVIADHPSPTAVASPALVSFASPQDVLVRDALVIGLVATGQERLRAALRRVAAAPELLAVTTRIVVVDAGRTPSATVLREAVRLPAGLVRVVRRPHADRAEALARALAEAVHEPRAGSVLLLDDSALAEPSPQRDSASCQSCQLPGGAVGPAQDGQVEVPHRRAA